MASAEPLVQPYFLTPDWEQLRRCAADNAMAAHAYRGPVVVQEAEPPPLLDTRLTPAAEGATATDSAKEEHTVTPADEGRQDREDPNEHEDPEDGSVWETVSLFEEILDEVEAFEYSGDGELGLLRLSVTNFLTLLQA